MLANSIKFTIVIPSKNEEKDILLAIESSLSQTYPQKEIIVVDDSTDYTKDIVGQYQDQGVILLNGLGTGCCQARNLGIKHSTGDVVVLLNADTRLPVGYLERILPYYEQGYDWVTTEEISYNQESVYSRLLQVQHQLEETDNPDFYPLTTSGYSVRKLAAQAVGWISGGDYPVNFCRDWTLGKKLIEAGFKKMHDPSIVVLHKSPDNFKEFWQVRKTRGLMSAYQPYFLFHRSSIYLFIKFTAKTFICFLHFALIVPSLIFVRKLSRVSQSGIRDFIPLYYAYFLHILARCAGEWEGWMYIARYEKNH